MLLQNSKSCSKVAPKSRMKLLKSCFQFLSVRPRPNDCNEPTQHVATLLGATCCVLLATVLRCVATCWVLLAQVWNWSNLSQQHPTYRNTSQHGGQTHATCCAQQCCDMLRSFGQGLTPTLKHQMSRRITGIAELNNFFHYAESITCRRTYWIDHG